MTVVFVGNTNNYPLLLALAMQRLGVDTRLVVTRKDPLHRPESKCPELAPGEVNWIFDASDLSEDDAACETLRIGYTLNFVYGSDAAILNDSGPALASAFGIPHLSLLTGTDLTYLANFSSARGRRGDWSEDFTTSPWGRLADRNWTRFVQKQRDGIVSGRAVIAPVRGLVPLADELLDDIGVPIAKRHFLPMADTITLRPWAANRQTVRGLRILWGARTTSTSFGAVPTTQDDKGVDVMIQAFAAFLARGGRGELRLVRKGQHVSEAAAMISALSLTEHVTWLDELTLRQFYDEVKAADVVCDQLGSSFPGMVAADAMALGRPVIANWRTELLAGQFGGELPAGHAASVEAVTDALFELTDESTRRTAGADGRAFAEQHFSPEHHAKRCLELLARR
jgi:hypothetical protein